MGILLRRSIETRSARVFTLSSRHLTSPARLHMGHALQHTMMDVMTRHKRMCGLPHSLAAGDGPCGHLHSVDGLARLRKKGRRGTISGARSLSSASGNGNTNRAVRSQCRCVAKARRSTGRARSSRWTRTFRASCAKCSSACTKRDGSIAATGSLTGVRNDQTVLSDLEVEKLPQAGKLYYLQYPIKNSDRRVTVATTRPETMLGDTAVAVNPNDDRYRDLVGDRSHCHLTDREIPIVADEFVDPEFGTGAVKITPAHDPNDYEMGLRHNLRQVVVIDPHAKMTARCRQGFAGLDRYKAREKVVEEFEALGLLEKVVDYEFSISKCERCKTVIEPLISMQWFLKMDQLRDLALDLMAREKKPRFVPEVPYEKVYTNWLENLRDWTISRQLWWGHQIPPGTRQRRSDRRPIAKKRRARKPARASSRRIRTCSTPGSRPRSGPSRRSAGPTRPKDLENFLSDVGARNRARHHLPLGVAHGDDGTEVCRQGPFDDVFITGTILDSQGQRMSKTKMNGIDPLDVFDKFGVDATRLTLAQVGSTDTRWNEKQVESYRNFANKIWNAARFCLLNSEGAEVKPEILEQSTALHDRWIVSRLNKTARDLNRAIETYEFHKRYRRCITSSGTTFATGTSSSQKPTSPPNKTAPRAPKHARDC